VAQDDIEKRLRIFEVDLVAHETQCEERWKTNFTRLTDMERQLSRIEKMIWTGGAATIFFLATIVATML